MVRREVSVGKLEGRMRVIEKGSHEKVVAERREGDRRGGNSAISAREHRASSPPPAESARPGDLKSKTQPAERPPSPPEQPRLDRQDGFRSPMRPVPAQPSEPSSGGSALFSRFFIDRPIFAAVLSIVITLAGGDRGLRAAARAVSADLAADRPGRLQLPRRQRPGRRRDGGGADRAAGQRRREHALHVVAVHQRRHVQPDRHVQARRRPEHGPGAGAEPRQPGGAAAARRDQADRRDRQEEVARHPDGDRAQLARAAATTSST